MSQQSKLRTQTLSLLKSAFVNYHQVHRQATRKFVDSTDYVRYLEEYLDKLSKYVPYLDSDVSKSFCITRLEHLDCDNSITYTIRLKGARCAAITQLRFGLEDKSIQIWI